MNRQRAALFPLRKALARRLLLLMPFLPSRSFRIRALSALPPLRPITSPLSTPRSLHAFYPKQKAHFPG